MSSDKSDAAYQRVVDALQAAALERDMLQAAVDRAHAAMSGSQYVGGPSEREAWQTAMDALGRVVTQHWGQPSGKPATDPHSAHIQDSPGENPVGPSASQLPRSN